MIYFDNAATTKLHPEVIQVVEQSMKDIYGNPSSVHLAGREAKIKLEESRRKIADYLQVKSSEVVFTSGASEAIAIALNGLISKNEIINVITSRLEHSAVLKTLDSIKKQGLIAIHYVSVDEFGCVDMLELEQLLSDKPGSLVALMHANNVFGKLNSIKEIGQLSKKNNAIFFCDTVQSMGKYDYGQLLEYVDVAICSAHKFHGPKGVGFMLVRKGIQIDALVLGGGQEKGIRSGTENLHAIIGVAKAVEIAYENMNVNQDYISELKNYLVEGLKKHFPGIQFIGKSSDEGLYNLVNFALPYEKDSSEIQFFLDTNNIAVSTGSACSSGAVKASAAVEEIQPNISSKAIRVSLSKYNTKKEVDTFLQTLQKV